MAKRHNHYESAVEAYLRRRAVAYVAVDERRRAIEPAGSLKSVDFIVSPGDDASRWLIDVKGRRFPSGQKRPQYWRNWTTADELRSLARWGERFGPMFTPLLLFAYELTADRSPVPSDEFFRRRGRDYALVAVCAEAYRQIARPLSARWGTVAAPVAEFRRLAIPLGELLDSTVAPLAIDQAGG